MYKRHKVLENKLGLRYCFSITYDQLKKITERS